VDESIGCQNVLVLLSLGYQLMRYLDTFKAASENKVFGQDQGE
jgi:hypothetical protein